MQQKEKDLQYLLSIRESKGQEGKREWTVSVSISALVLNEPNQILLEQIARRGI